jgi:hypothetical protein
MRAAYLVLVLFLSVFILWMNIGVHRSPAIGTQEEVNAMHAQLRYLRLRMHAGLGVEMQRLFPEGSAFAHALYGLACCGLAEAERGDAAVHDMALREAKWAYVRLQDAEIRERFPASAELPHGVFFAGWSNVLLARIIEVEGPGPERPITVLFDRRSAELAGAFANSPSPFLESYPGQAWPADATVAMASLSLHAELRGPAHAPVIARWLEQAAQRTDTNGFIPHAWDPITDREWQSARGSSQSLINSFLPTIDSAFAAGQFALYRRHFFMERCGLPVVREHPHGVHGRGDVDSGPVILGVGSSATIVAAGACRANGDLFRAREFGCTTDALGFPKGGDRRHYIFGALPIADLFIAWGRSTPIRSADPPAPPKFLRFHVWSTAILLLLWSPFLVRWWKRFRA